MKRNNEYYAFISYKREDEKWAKWLQHKLEYYRFPKNLNGYANLPSKIRPIFRDVTDLNPGLLTEEINNALHNSEWLIVICSPRITKSIWVCKEIQMFINLGRADHIIPFIIEGSPFSNDCTTECYPDILLNFTENNELLAANINEMGRDAAVIKIIARMFNLRFDVLWHRYAREQKYKRRIWVGGSILLALCAFCISGYFVKQNNIIEVQNTQLQKLVLDLKEANNTFSLLTSERKQYSFVGEVLGSGCQSIDNMNFEFHPYEPIVAFSDNWGCWLHYLNSGVEVQLPTEGINNTDIILVGFSNDGTELIAEGWLGIFVWNVDSHELIRYYRREDNFLESKEFKQKFSCYYENDNQEQLEDYHYDCTIKYDSGIVNILNKKTGERICSTQLNMGEDSIYRYLLNPKYKEILFVTDKKAALYDDNKKNFVLFLKGYDNAYNLDFSKNGDFLRVENNIYERTMKIDTIRNLKYAIYNKNFPTFGNKNHLYDKKNHASLKINGQNIKYTCGKFVKNIEVVRDYTMGNSQEYLTDALFAGPNKIVAIVSQGKFRIYNTKSWTLMGTLENYVWTDYNECMGNETRLCHAESFIAAAEYINKKLYVLSSGGIIRIYNIDRYRLESIIELPVEIEEDELFKPIDKCYFSEDGSKIYYSFEGDSLYYLCELPSIILK